MLIKYNNYLTFTKTLGIKHLDSIVSFVYIKYMDIIDEDNINIPIICFNNSNVKFNFISFFSNNKKYKIFFKIISSPERDKFYLLFQNDNYHNIFIDIDRYEKFYNSIIKKFINYNIYGRSARLHS